MRFGPALPRASLLAALAVGPVLTPVIPLAAVAQQAGPARPAFRDGQARVVTAFNDRNVKPEHSMRAGAR